MTTRKNSKIRRIDPEFNKDMEGCARIRIEKGLANLTPKEISMVEMTRLLRRTLGYNLSLEELKTKPKRK